MKDATIKYPESRFRLESRQTLTLMDAFDETIFRVGGTTVRSSKTGSFFCHMFIQPSKHLFL